MKRKKSDELFQRNNIDILLLSCLMSLMAIGWCMQYSLSTTELEGKFFDFSTYVGRHTIWMGISIALGTLLFAFNHKFWNVFAYPMFGASILLLILVLFFGDTINGARSWFALGPINLQPSEIAKVSTALALASFLSTYRVDLKRGNNLYIAIGIVLLPFVLIILQPDAGSALVFLSFVFVLYRAGLPGLVLLFLAGLAVMFVLGLIINPLYLLVILVIIQIGVLSILYYPIKHAVPTLILILSGMGLVFYNGFERMAALGWLALFGALLVALVRKGFYRHVIVLVIVNVLVIGVSFLANFAYNNVLESHQQERINVWLQPDKCDPFGSLYNILQSKTAIASGGFMGKGYGQGTMSKFNYIPEQNTDFIFCTIGEEQGFMGSLALVTLFAIMLWRILKIAERQRKDFVMYYAYGVFGLLFFHFFMNISMTMGLVPVVGIPLPFISYGGSSLLIFTTMVVILLKLDSDRYAV